MFSRKGGAFDEFGGAFDEFGRGFGTGGAWRVSLEVILVSLMSLGSFPRVAARNGVEFDEFGKPFAAGAVHPHRPGGESVRCGIE